MTSSRSSSILSTFALGRGPWKTFDPFLFCVHHLDDYPAGDSNMGAPTKTFSRRDIGSDFSYIDGWSMYHGETVPGFPAHPHRGFETVTVTRQGIIDHFDSMGATGRYGYGDVQWMTAGSGVQHCEMFPLLNQDKPNQCELYQLWLNLPKRSKFAKPAFTMFWAEDKPIGLVKDANGIVTKVDVIAGRVAGTSAKEPPPDSFASQPDADVAIWIITIPKGGSFTVPPTATSTNRAIYTTRGDVLVDETVKLPARNGAKLNPVVPCIITAVSDVVEVLLLQGRPIGEPVAQHGPFVMNTKEEIDQCFKDFKATQFGGWPWRSHDLTHPREVKRHAKFPDGHTELPGASQDKKAS